jgi:hypothetical protein
MNNASTMLTLFAAIFSVLSMAAGSCCATTCNHATTNAAKHQPQTVPAKQEPVWAQPLAFLQTIPSKLQEPFKHFTQPPFFNQNFDYLKVVKFEKTRFVKGMKGAVITARHFLFGDQARTIVSAVSMVVVCSALLAAITLSVVLDKTQLQDMESFTGVKSRVEAEVDSMESDRSTFVKTLSRTQFNSIFFGSLFGLVFVCLIVTVIVVKCKQ